MSVGVRNRRVDLLRGVSIILVMLHHFNIPYALDDTTLSWLIGWQAVHAIVRNGNYAVTMFFVMSGFLITSNAEARWGSLQNLSARAFYASRAARIIPSLLLLLAVVNALAAVGLTMFQNHPEEDPPVSFWLVNFASLTFWMNGLMATPAGWLNYPLGVLWSLSVEEVFYLSFPILCLTLRRPAFLVAFWAAVILIGPIWRGLHQADEAQFLYSYLASFDGIAVGCCTALLARRASFSGVWAGVAQLLVLAAMTVLYLARSIAVTNVYGVTLMALGTACLLSQACHRPGAALSGRRAFGAVEWLGRLSYELYLFHLVVLGLLRSAFPPGATFGDRKLALLLAYLALSAGIAAMVGRAYSEPLNRGIRARLERDDIWQLRQMSESPSSIKRGRDG